MVSPVQPGNISKSSGYGLRTGTLSPMETLAQSISAVAPTVTPFVSIPLIFSLVGNGTWLAYVLATGGTLLVAGQPFFPFLRLP